MYLSIQDMACLLLFIMLGAALNAIGGEGARNK